jgi:hypothetical protein
MKKKTNGEEEDIKPDLKHDTMEFSAATDGDDRLDIDDASYEEEGIDADELAALEDDPASIAAALNEAELDREADPDNLTDEDWTDDLPDNNEEEEEDEEERDSN